MSSLDNFELYYEDTSKTNKIRKKDLRMSDKVTIKKPTTKVDKLKNTLSIYTYLNWKRFGVSVAIDDGIKINIAWFETNIKFEKK